MTTSPLALGRYADVIAILHHYHSEPWSDVLDALGIGDAEWTVTDAHWTEQLAVCYARRQESVAFEMATRYAKMRRRLARQGLGLAAAVAKLGTGARAEATPGGRSGAGEASENGAADGPGAGQPNTAVPSYLREAAPGATPAPAPRTDVPSHVAFSPPANVAFAPPANVAVSSQGNVAVGPPANMAVAPSVNVAVAPPRHAGTMAFDGPVPVPLPFRDGESTLAAPPPPTEGTGAADAGKKGSPRPASGMSGETVAPSDLAAVMKRVLPFAGGAAGSPAPATPPVATPAKPPVSPSATPSVATPAKTPVATPTTPPVAGGLTVEQYASLCEDLAVAGAQASEVLRRYGLGPEEKAAVEEQWTTLFQRQPATLQAWETARKMYRAWRSKQGT